MIKRCLTIRLRVLYAVLCLLAFGPGTKAFGQANPPLWSASSTYKIGDLAQYANETYRAITAMPAGKVQVPANPSYWEMNEVRVSDTLSVGAQQQLPNLATAWKYILNARIDGSAVLALNLISNETLTTSFNLDHPCGSAIQLTTSNGASVTFGSSAASSTGFVLDSGHSFGGIFNLTLNGSVEVGGTPSVAVLVSTGGNMKLMGITINNFDTGIQAQDNSTIIIGSGVATNGFDFAAVYSLNHSLIDIQSPMNIAGATSFNTPQSQYGFYASGNATLEANSCACRFCGACYIADKGAHMEAASATATNEGIDGVGFLANTGGTIEATGSGVTLCRTGYLSEYKSLINAPNCKCNDTSPDTDFVASISSLINASGQTGGTQFSPPKNTQSTDGSYIVD
ncbi:MAG TPA: hypothetical protein VGL56_06575 [Fimbriimonadaceae bacterium]|jgi:hypothetical protein